MTTTANKTTKIDSYDHECLKADLENTIVQELTVEEIKQIGEIKPDWVK